MLISNFDISPQMYNVIFVALIEIVMTLFISYIIIFTYQNKDQLNFKRWALVNVLLVMMASMLNAITYYLGTVKTFLNTIIAVNFSMLSMSAVIILIFWFALSKKDFVFNKASKNTFILLLLWNEISMGVLVFLLAFGMPYLTGNFLYDFINFLSFGINGYLFITPMAVEMLVFLFVVKPNKSHRNILLALLSMSVLSPVLAGNPQFVGPGLFTVTGSMVLFMTILFERIAKGKLNLTEREMGDMSYLFLIFVLMSSAIFVGTLFVQPFGIAWGYFALTMVLGMSFYFKSSLNNSLGVEKRIGWKKNKRFLFWILGASFISEWFLSAAIVFHFYVPVKPGGIANLVSFSNYLGGVNVFTPLSMLVEVPFFIGGVTDTPWFWTIMGLEMSALVIIRMRSLQWKEKRWNLALALTAYWGWTVWFQSDWWTMLFGTSAYKLPLWPNIGELGPFLPVLVAGIVGSYVLFAVLAILFGRRSYCSTLCPSSVMYGGTLGQSMVSYNYESSFSKKHIGSKYKNSVMTVAYNSWIIAVLLSVLSYYSVTTIPWLTIYGIDTAGFYTTIVWNLLWYLFFISIPFIGMSPCRRYGWCSTGTFVGFFSRIGLFRLKVRDSQTCVTCPTKDCVVNCEVGLGDLAAQFIKKGEFRSSKCVGAGSCLEACPYDNIFFYDVRDYVKEKIRASK